MTRLALWTFDGASGATLVTDSETADGTAQDGTFQGGGAVDGAGTGVFDGSNDYVEIPNNPGFELETGSIVVSFTQHTAAAGDRPFGPTPAQTLFSRDAYGFEGGGHLSIFIKSDGSVGVRHQDTEQTFKFEGGDITPGQPATVIYNWGPDGSELIVDGAVVDSGAEALTMAGNSEPITIGASQAITSPGTADKMVAFFDGEIEGVAIHDAPVSAGAVPCFTRGTLIQTPRGAVPVEHLRRGDAVCTLHHGPQCLRWIGSKRIALTAGAGTAAKLRPVRIAAGALGQGLPKRDLRVSRQHRMLVSSRIAERMCGGDSVLVAAIKLTCLPGIEVDHSVDHADYFHLMFDRHEVVFAEGAPSESLYTGPEAMKALPREARREILSLFPALAGGLHRPASAIPIPCGAKQKRLIGRHAKNGKPLLEIFELPG